MIRFILCNLLICGIVGLLLAARRIFKNCLSGRMQYHLWFLLLGLLAVPFLPFRLIGFFQIFAWLHSPGRFSASAAKIAAGGTAGIDLAANADWLREFTLSIDGKTPAGIGYCLAGIWIAGIFVCLLWTVKSACRLSHLKKSALPLQNPEVGRLYAQCLEEMNIHRKIPVRSTAFLKSPVIAGLLKPCIYLPIHLISDYSASDLRFILLHELQHYSHHDAIVNHLINLAGILYWFNPAVRYALREMRDDREVACDTSVLMMLSDDAYAAYGNALINFAEKISRTLSPFAAGLGGTMKQMKRRMINIASYQKPTRGKKRKGMAVFVLLTVLLLGISPLLSTYAVQEQHYRWKTSSENISNMDLSPYFGAYEGSFVLYDPDHDAWIVHDMDRATLRVSPDSTWKIYTALFGLESGVITPDHSLIAWNGEPCPFEAWEADQTLRSAMDSSVNWYFHSIDEQLTPAGVSRYMRQIHYGNETINGDFSTYWMESSLKISPVEQVELLTKLLHNDLGFAPEYGSAVKASIRLFSSDAGTLYGKTGTGRVDGQDINGWFVGCLETAQHTWFFAANIGADCDASGTRAAEITMSILSDLGIWG